MGSMASLSLHRPAFRTVLKSCQQTANFSRHSTGPRSIIRLTSFFKPSQSFLLTSKFFTTKHTSGSLSRTQIRSAAVAEQLEAASNTEQDPLPLSEGLVWTNRTHCCGHLTKTDVGQKVRPVRVGGAAEEPWGGRICQSEGPYRHHSSKLQLVSVLFLRLA